jgi:hypothetical protein
MDEHFNGTDLSMLSLYCCSIAISQKLHPKSNP